MFYLTRFDLFVKVNFFLLLGSQPDDRWSDVGSSKTTERNHSNLPVAETFASALPGNVSELN